MRHHCQNNTLATLPLSPYNLHSHIIENRPNENKVLNLSQQLTTRRVNSRFQPGLSGSLICFKGTTTIIPFDNNVIFWEPSSANIAASQPADYPLNQDEDRRMLTLVSHSSPFVRPSIHPSRKRKRLQKKINPPQKSRSRAKFRKQNAYRCFVVGLSSHLCLILQTTTYLRTNQHISIARSGSGKVDGNRRQTRGSREKNVINTKRMSRCVLGA